MSTVAKIIIKKGFIYHGGRLYKAGEIVDIADAHKAKVMVARSGGDFDFYHGEEVSAEAPAAGQPEEELSESDNSAPEMPEADMAGSELPAIDVNADVQPGKGKKK